jgi:hypothetical protein
MAKATVGNNQRNEHFTMRDSKEFSSCREAEAYLDSVNYWADPVLISDTDEADKFQRRHPILDAAQNGRLHYKG